MGLLAILLLCVLCGACVIGILEYPNYLQENKPGRNYRKNHKNIRNLNQNYSSYGECSKEKLQQAVASTSVWYKKVLELNAETNWCDDILDHGHSECYLFADSKAQFDNARPRSRVEDFLIAHRERIEKDRETLRKNWEIYEAYEQKFGELASQATPEFCKLIGIDYNQYIEIEKEMVEQAKLPIIYGYGITCKVVYISPQGRNRYEKELYYDDFDIDDIFRSIDRRDKEQKTETYRRQVERSKMTPSLRYEVMSRDGFRCCLCGRTADHGVELEVDHVIPVSKGGTSDMSNLQTLCRDCNRGKGAKY